VRLSANVLRTLTSSAVLLLLLLVPGALGAATLPTGFQDVVVLDGLRAPTSVAFAADGRIFVAEKQGTVKVFDSLSDTTPTTFADLRREVFNGYDRGLLGLALDPQFPAKPYVYVLYTRDAPIGGTAPAYGVSPYTAERCPDEVAGCMVSGRLARLTASGDVMTGAITPLVDDWCIQHTSHSIGALAFGPDGSLYASGGEGSSPSFTDYGQKGSPLNPCGDPPAGVGGQETPPTAEGGSLRAQDLRTTGDPVGLDGTVIRVDPATGQGVPSNPMAGSADANARRIVAYGLRNPFRFALRPQDGALWIGDVGAGTWEEIDRVSAGATQAPNFGWPCYEGSGRMGRFDNLGLNLCESLYAEHSATAPYFAYRHDSEVAPADGCAPGGSATTGLAFYEGSAYPSRYHGALFLGDYARGCIWAMLPGADGVPDPANVEPFETGTGTPVQLLAGPAGDIYYVDILGGALHRITHFDGNTPPIAVASADRTSGDVPLTVHFDGTASTDPDGDAVTYAWDLDGDGAFDDSTSAKPSFTYNTPGPTTVRLRVTDPQGAGDTDTLTVTAGSTAPVPTIAAPSASLTWATDDAIAFHGSASDAEDGPLPASALSWTLILHHCYTADNCHEHLADEEAGVASGTFIAPDHPYPSYLELRLTATDSGGLSRTASVRLDPRTVSLAFVSTPNTAVVSAGESTAPTTFTHTFIVGSTVSVSAPATETVAGAGYRFLGWSDGGPASHDLVAPSSARTYAATFALSSALIDDGFERGGLDAWQNHGMAAETTLRSTGLWAARASTTSAAKWADRALPTLRKDVFARARINLVRKSAFPLLLLGFTMSGGAPQLSLYVDSTNHLSLHNGRTGTDFHSAVAVRFGAWHTIRLHQVVAGTSSRSEVWWDGTKVTGLSRTLSLGTIAAGRVRIGDARPGRSYDVVFDDVAVSATQIPL
jgi:glucose/arabinose dehydrogenase